MTFLEIKEEINQFGTVVYYWGSKKTLIIGQVFEETKDFFVKRLIWRRGSLSKPFLHTSFGIILSAGIVTAPIIANTYPTIGMEQKFTEETPSSVLNTQTAATMGTETVESDKPRDKVISYKVQSGETLSSIAKKFGISSDTILWQNRISGGNDLSVGQSLQILPVSGVQHTVSAGETIYSIAAKYGLPSPQPIVDFPFNTFRDDETFALNIGDQIIVPGGIKPADVPTESQPTYLAQAPKVSYTGNASGSFIWPTAGIITQERTWYHTGLDIANNIGTEIHAANAGRVTIVLKQGYGYGWHVVIDHGTYQTLYGHMSRIDVVEGQDVGQGQTIGAMGSTGRSTGPHLHFEVRQGGSILSPRDFLP